MYDKELAEKNGIPGAIEEAARNVGETFQDPRPAYSNPAVSRNDDALRKEVCMSELYRTFWPKLQAEALEAAAKKTPGKLLAGLKGCRKIKLTLLNRLGELDVSGPQMSAVLYLARNQNISGHTCTNAHILCGAIHCSLSTFPDLMRWLMDHEIITAFKSAGSVRDEDAIWYVQLNGNNFITGYSGENHYVSLAPEIFASASFMAMDPVEKYIVLKVFYENAPERGTTTEEWNDFYARYHNVTPIFYHYLIEDCVRWSGKSREFCEKAYQTIQERWNIIRTERPVNLSPRGMWDREDLFADIPIEDAIIRHSDGFTYLTNLVLAVLEEEGIHLAKRFYENREACNPADLILLYAREEQTRLKEVYRGILGADFKRGELSRAEDKEQAMLEIYLLEEPFRRFVYDSTHYADEFGFDCEKGTYYPLHRRLSRSTLLTSCRMLPSFAMPIIMDIAASYRCLELWAERMDIKLDDVNLLHALQEMLDIVRHGTCRRGNLPAKILYRNRMR